MTKADAVELTQNAKAMLGQIPGLLSVEMGDALDALEVTKVHSQGYTWAIVVTLEKPEDFASYTTHPAHDK